ncbi:YraN family protein [Caulobacter sp. 17J65-9]|uniref:YraN family protein n=1 Tax=Caulobacter sp. 17J65-9 TaxID=2709382 RepID=UPI003204BF1C
MTVADRRLQRRQVRAERGRKGRDAGRFGEVVAALLLMAKGWQILGFRLRTPQGEIDLLARRGRVLAVVEVKRRATLELAAEAVGEAQRERLLRAAEGIVRRRPVLRHHDVRIDLIALAPGRFPRHLKSVFTKPDLARG